MTVTERFLQYVSIDTQSDPKSGLHPSSAKQLRLAELLVSQLKEMGVQDVTLDDHGYVMVFYRLRQVVKRKNRLDLWHIWIPLRICPGQT